MVKFIAAHASAEVRVVPSVTDGVTFDEVTKAAKTWKADLIVIATGGLIASSFADHDIVVAFPQQGVHLKTTRPLPVEVVGQLENKH